MSQISMLQLPNWADVPTCGVSETFTHQQFQTAIGNAPQDGVTWDASHTCVGYVSPIDPWEVVWSPVDNQPEVPYLYTGTIVPVDPPPPSVHVTPEPRMGGVYVILVIAILMVWLYEWWKERSGL